MKLLWVIVLLGMLLFPITASDAKTFPEGVIIPGIRVGYITATTTEADLVRDYGKQNVIHAMVNTGEGETQEATILCPLDTLRTLQIFWEDTQAHKNPTMIRLKGKKTIWKTQDGITLGTTLHEIEKLNNAPFCLAGFQWDYEGTVIHCGEGKLTCLGVDSAEAEELSPRTLLLRLQPDWDSAYQLFSHELDLVAGDKWFSSNDPTMQKINPRVYEMYVFFSQNLPE